MEARYLDLTIEKYRLLHLESAPCGGVEMEKLDRITVNPGICLGQPTIRGMRITVSTILKMLASGGSVQDVLEAYPELQVEDVQQAMKYAAWVVSDQIHAAKA
jgi:uncharacterized protein (DUF433 family)